MKQENEIESTRSENNYSMRIRNVRAPIESIHLVKNDTRGRADRSKNPGCVCLKRRKNKRQERERPRRILDSKSRTTPGWVAGWLADSRASRQKTEKTMESLRRKRAGIFFLSRCFYLGDTRWERGVRGMEMVYLERKRRGGGRGRRIVERQRTGEKVQDRRGASWSMRGEARRERRFL